MQQSDVDIAASIEAKAHGTRLWHVSAIARLHAGAARAADPRARGPDGRGAARADENTFFVLPREFDHRILRPALRPLAAGALWRSEPEPELRADYFHIPHAQLMEFTWMMEA